MMHMVFYSFDKTEKPVTDKLTAGGGGGQKVFEVVLAVGT